MRSCYNAAMRKQLLLSLLVVSALGCGKGRYEIVAVPPEVDNIYRCHAYRLDTQTGEVFCITGERMSSVTQINVPH